MIRGRFWYYRGVVRLHYGIVRLHRDVAGLHYDIVRLHRDVAGLHYVIVPYIVALLGYIEAL